MKHIIKYNESFSSPKKAKTAAKEITQYILTEISKLDIGSYFSYPYEISPYTINDVLTSLYNENVEILSNINGHDMDWSMIDNLVIEDREYEVWGSVSTGDLFFKRVKLS